MSFRIICCNEQMTVHFRVEKGLTSSFGMLLSSQNSDVEILPSCLGNDTEKVLLPEAIGNPNLF